MYYVHLFGRGCVLVCLVSAQTYALAREWWGYVPIGAFLIACTWWANTYQAAHPTGRLGWLVYAAGSSLGAVLGPWTLIWLMG